MSARPPLAGGGWRERLAQIPGGRWLWFGVGALLVVGVAVLAVAKAKSSASSSAGAADPAARSAEVASAPASAAVPIPAPQPEVPAALSQAAPAEAPAAPVSDAGVLSPNVRIVFKTYPPRRASVMWGSERLGFTDRGKPLVVERPRDSGSMDVVIRAPGYIPVHTRAYTFDDAVVEVRITPNDKKDTIYGYQQPLPPESADAGAPL